MVVVKLPEFENSAMLPFTSDSEGLLPPSAPPILILFHASATPRQFAPQISTPFACPMALIIDESLIGTFSVSIIIFFKSGLNFTTSDTPSFTPEGGRYMTAVLNLCPAFMASATELYTGMLPILVSRTCPLRPGPVPKPILQPENSWLTGVTARLSVPRMFNTQTLSSLVAMSAREFTPT